MPRPRQTITAEALPAAYRSLTPLPGREFPIQPPLKEKLQWECTVCGYVNLLSVDNMRAHPYPEHSGCKACRSAMSAVERARENCDWLTITSWFYDHSNPYAQTEKNKFNALAFSGRCDQGHPQKFDRPFLAYRSHTFVPCQECKRMDAVASQQRNLLKGNQKASPIIDYWAGASLECIGTNIRNDFLYQVQIPGTNGAPWPDSVGRIRGAFDTSHEGKPVSLTELRRRVRQDKRDRERMFEFMRLGRRYGSTVHRFGLLPGKKELGAAYQTVTGNITTFYSMRRTEESNAGRSIPKQTQALIGCVLMEAFPEEKWRFDDRSYLRQLEKAVGGKPRLSANAELDIGTQGIVDGGIWVEYQGYQSHREDPKVMATDQLKISVCQGRCLLLVIDKLDLPYADTAIQAVKSALQEHPDRDRADQALTVMTEPDPEKVSNRWLNSKLGLAHQRGRQLKDKMAFYGHRLLSDLTSVYSNGYFDYQCGYCHRISADNRVKPYIDRPSEGCKHCERERATDNFAQDRLKKWEKHPLWVLMSETTRDELCNNQETFFCPQCGGQNWKAKLSERTDYLCLLCLDTGRRITDQGQSAGTVYQHLETVRNLISEIDEQPSTRFEDQVTTESDKIWISMTVNGQRQSFPMSQWAKEKNKRFSKVFHSSEERYGTLLEAFPDYRLLESKDPEIIFFHSGCATLAPNGEVIEHPTLRVPRSQLSGKKYKESKAAMTRNHVSDSLDSLRQRLSYMHDVHHGAGRSSGKTLGDIEARWRLRAACVGTEHIPLEHVRHPSVMKPGLRPTDPIKTTDPDIMFQCADSRHPLKTTKPDSRFSTAGGKKGFCTRCLKEAGLKQVDFTRLEQEASIVSIESVKTGLYP